MLQNKRGFNFIEVIIAIVIVSIIAIGLSSLFSVVLDTPLITNRRKAYMYAQKEMENLFNKNYDEIVSIAKTNYPDDTDFDYEIEANEIEAGLKSVRVNFYPKGSDLKIAELYTLFIKTTFSICDDFEENRDRYPPWDWNPKPPGSWKVVEDPNDPSNSVYWYRKKGLGTSYPSDFSGSNYRVSSKFFIKATDNGNADILLGARVDPSTDYGYYVMVYAYIRRFWWLKYAIYYPYLIKTDSSGSTTLSSLPSRFEFIFGDYTDVHEIGLKMEDNVLRFYFDSDEGNATDSEFSSGNIMLVGYNQNNNTKIYFDDVCAEGE